MCHAISFFFNSLPQLSHPLHLFLITQVLLRTRRLAQFGREIAGRQDTPLWLDAESGMYTFSLDRVVTEEKDKNRKNDLVR